MDPATLLGRGDGLLLAARACRTEPEAVLWAEEVAAGAVRTVGLCTARGDGLAGAERALVAAEEFDAGPVCPALLADALGEARRIAESEGILAHEQRRRRLLRRLRARLGPVQLEHTAAHGDQVARTAARLAQLMRLSPEQVEHARLAGLLHDIGKLAFPEDLLAKRQGLSPRERSVLARHPRIGAAIAGALGAPAAVAEAVARHHDRADAPQPPPLAARIVCVADALVTMTSARAYSAARSFTEALAELRRGRGGPFDPGAVVAAHLLGAGAMALAA
jgi:putative nucleotidyltransferase with HDIG domain